MGSAEGGSRRLVSSMMEALGCLPAKILAARGLLKILFERAHHPGDL